PATLPPCRGQAWPSRVRAPPAPAPPPPARPDPRTRVPRWPCTPARPRPRPDAPAPPIPGGRLPHSPPTPAPPGRPGRAQACAHRCTSRTTLRPSPLPPSPPAPLALARAAIPAAPAALADPAPAPAAKDLDAVVVTATGFEQKIVDAPASISVITREDLARRPYITLLDAVRDLEGVDIGETRDKTGQGTISMRGMGPDYTLVLINGRRQNNHGDIYPNNFGGNQFTHIPPLDAIERIEVIRGPMSTLYGADAMGGVINIITRKGLDTWAGSLTLGRTSATNDD